MRLFSARLGRSRDFAFIATWLVLPLRAGQARKAARIFLTPRAPTVKGGGTNVGKKARFACIGRGLNFNYAW